MGAPHLLPIAPAVTVLAPACCFAALTAELPDSLPRALSRSQSMVATDDNSTGSRSMAYDGSDDISTGSESEILWTEAGDSENRALAKRSLARLRPRLLRRRESTRHLFVIRDSSFG